MRLSGRNEMDWDLQTVKNDTCISKPLSKEHGVEVEAAGTTSIDSVNTHRMRRVSFPAEHG